MTIKRVLFDRKIFIFCGGLLFLISFVAPWILKSENYSDDLQTSFTISAALIAFLIFLDSIIEKKSMAWTAGRNLIESLQAEIFLNLNLVNSVGELKGKVEYSPMNFYDPSRAIFPLNKEILVYGITDGQEYFVSKKDLLLKLVKLNNEISKFNIQTKELHDFRFSNPELLGKANDYYAKTANNHNLNGINDLVLKEWFLELRLRNWAISTKFLPNIKKLLYEIKCDLEKHHSSLSSKKPVYRI